MKLETAIQTAKFKNETHKAGLNILYTAWWLKTLTNAAIKPFDITQEQYNVLRILKGKHPETMSVKDIASRMIEKNSNVPRIIDRLEIKKLIERNQCTIDGRHTKISLTLKGIEMLEQSTVAINNVWDTRLCITEEEATTINSLIEKLRTQE